MSLRGRLYVWNSARYETSKKAVSTYFGYFFHRDLQQIYWTDWFEILYKDSSYEVDEIVWNKILNKSFIKFLRQLQLFETKLQHLKIIVLSGDYQKALFPSLKILHAKFQLKIFSFQVCRLADSMQSIAFSLWTVDKNSWSLQLLKFVTR